MTIQTIIQAAKETHESLASDLSSDVSELIEQSIMKRKRLATEMRMELRNLRKMKKAIRIDADRREAEAQEEMDAILGLLSIQDDDIRELEDRRWTVIRAEKEMSHPRTTNPNLA